MDIIALLVFLIPAYVANAVPVILGGGTRLDLGKTFIDGKPLLGKGKTIRGFVAGVIGGTVVAWIIANYYQVPFFLNMETQIIAGFVLSLGTMIGDTIGSFLKRRMNIEQGKPFLPDTIIFLIIALVLVYPFVTGSLYDPLNIGFILALTVILHRLTNFLANQTGLKKVPW